MCVCEDMQTEYMGRPSLWSDRDHNALCTAILTLLQSKSNS